MPLPLPPLPRREWRRRILQALAGLTLVLVLVLPPCVASQAPDPAAGAPQPVSAAGSFEVAPVRILGVPALVVASPQLPGAGEVIAARRRAEVIEANLRLLYEPHTLCTVPERLSEWLLEGLVLKGPQRQRLCGQDRWGLSGRPEQLRLIATPQPDRSVEIQAVLPGRLRPVPLLTVTDADARLHGLTPVELAEDWRQVLQRRLVHARRTLQPDQLRLRLWFTVFGVGLSGACMALCLRAWGRTRLALREQMRAAQADEELWGRGPQRLQRRTRLLAALVLAQLMIISGLLVAAVPGRIPLALAVLLQPLLILLRALAVAVVVWLLRQLLHFLLRNWRSNLTVPLEQRARREQRYRNLLQAGRRLLNLAGVIVFAVLVVAGLPGVDRQSLGTWLAGGALLGALALVFQSLLRDFAAGLVTLIDDHYAVGDWVEIDRFSGDVEDVGVLSTVLRTLDQRVVVLPNSRCEALVNHTRLRSGVELSLPLDPACPQLQRALPVVREECESFASDPAWASELLAPPLVRGVKRVTPLMVELSILVLTRAGQQWAVERELLGRLVSRMEREGLRMAAARALPGQD